MGEGKLYYFDKRSQTQTTFGDSPAWRARKPSTPVNFFLDVSPPTDLPLGSPVLQRSLNSANRVFEFYSKLRSELTQLNEATGAAAPWKQIADLDDDVMTSSSMRYSRLA
jgi:hypothetical protein